MTVNASGIVWLRVGSNRNEATLSCSPEFPELNKFFQAVATSSQWGWFETVGRVVCLHRQAEGEIIPWDNLAKWLEGVITAHLDEYAEPGRHYFFRTELREEKEIVPDKSGYTARTV